MSARDVSKNDSKNHQNHHQSVSEIPRIDVDKVWENKIKDQLYSHDSNSSNLEKNSPATAKFLEKSNVSKESNEKNQVVINTNSQGFLPILTNANFLALWGGQVFCQLADKVYLVLMIALINTQFQSEGSSISGWVSALMMTFTIPAVLFGSLAGVFVDRWTKKTVLVSTNIWRGILVLGIVPLLWLAKDWHSVGNIPAGFLIILAVTFLVSTLTQFFAPAEQAVIPLIVKPRNLLSANSLYTTTMMASVIVGFAIGEPLLSAADALWLKFVGSGGLGKEILVGGSYAIAGLILLLLKTDEKPQLNKDVSNDIFADLKDGFVYLGKNHRLRNALIQLIILFSVLAALTVLAVRIAEIIPNISADQFGFLLASGGVGIALGAIVLGQFGENFSTSQLSLTGCAGMVISLTGLAIFTQQLWVVLFLIGLLGVSGALVGIPLQTAIQTETPAQMRGKVFGLQNNLVNIALTLPLALAGIAETFFGLQTVFLALAAIVLCGGLLTRYKSP
ncbi:MFS transporter [Plectonema cf. radiosum LEGE 06105]|uniref:MFS transporter n=1 Tax=Plectonema cf. radiosum LEGE 06105 TaxID=945769 RepID=A0A8J7F2B5_9CYAN|nr:MFS transporter [Plectonema radiosum]MBE9212508.1 MFS transporter [Plectonema cf. radiosum LEGE 06105]